MRGKYTQTKDRVPVIQARGRDSPLWKAICKVSPQIIEGTGWSVGNERQVRFWKDKWLHGYGRLIHHTMADITDVLVNAKVADMVQDNQW